MPRFEHLLTAVNLDRGVSLADHVHLADNALARLVGLLRTTEANFQPGAGLWLRPSQGIHTIGMAYPIDAVYLDAGLRVLHLAATMKPWRVGRVMLRCRSVLELPAGTARRTGTQLGDQLAIEAV